MGITGSLGFLLTQGRTDSELAASVRLHIPGMSRATVQAFGVLQGLFGSSAGYLHGRSDGTASAIISTRFSQVTRIHLDGFQVSFSPTEDAYYASQKLFIRAAGEV